jgi:hypothetical protein
MFPNKCPLNRVKLFFKQVLTKTTFKLKHVVSGMERRGIPETINLFREFRRLIPETTQPK